MNRLLKVAKVIVNKTPIPFWFAQGRRELRYRYRDGVSVLLRATSGVFFRVEVRGKKNFTFKSSTILACSHKRDADLAIIIPHLYSFRRPSKQRHMRMLFEVTRDDMYERGFLVAYFPWLNWARPILARMSIARMMRDLQTCPVKLPDEQTVGQLLQETIRIEGNLPAVEALTGECREKLLGSEANNPALTLNDAFLRAPFLELSSFATIRIFQEPLFTRIRDRHYQTLKEQLHFMTRVLDRGASLFIFPEGRVTRDGAFQKMRAALTRVVQSSRADIRMLPVNVTYDFMDTGRPRAIMVVGNEVEGIKRMPKNQFVEFVGKAIAGLACVTMSGLGSKYLMEALERGDTALSRSMFMEDLWQEARKLKEAGLQLDRDLENRALFEKRFARFLDYCQKKGGIFQASVKKGTLKKEELLTLDALSLKLVECQKPSHHPVLYCYNELMSLLETYALVEPRPVPQDNVLNFKDYRRQGNAV